MIRQASEGYGECVRDSNEIPTVFARALYAIKIKKRQVLLSIIGS